MLGLGTKVSMTGKGGFMEVRDGEGRGLGVNKVDKSMDAILFTIGGCSLCWGWEREMTPARSFVPGGISLSLQAML